MREPGVPPFMILEWVDSSVRRGGAALTHSCTHTLVDGCGVPAGGVWCARATAAVRSREGSPWALGVRRRLQRVCPFTSSRGKETESRGVREKEGGREAGRQRQRQAETETDRQRETERGRQTERGRPADRR